jgi:hypothetical protein
MYYGSLFPKDIHGGSIDTARLISVCEVCSLLRSNSITEGGEPLHLGNGELHKIFQFAL